MSCVPRHQSAIRYMNYRPEIDGLRALAVLPVILFHAGFEAFGGGFVGVDVFFVISGYLITTIIITELDEGKFSLVNFYERRARRILPALFFVMAVSLLFAWLWLYPADLKQFGGSMAAVSVFASNVFFYVSGNGYFRTATEHIPLLHTWSLAVEEQYYLIFPVFLMLAWRIGIKWIHVILAAVFVISLGLAQWAADNNIRMASYYLLPTRGWELLIGVFAAFYLKHHKLSESQSVNQALSLLGLGMVVYSIFALDETTPFPSVYALIPTLGTCLLILCAVPNTLVHSMLSIKPIVGIGLISYSTYLWHVPLFVFTRHALFLQHLSSFQVYVLIALSLALAWFSWRFVEKPFRNKLIIDRKQIFTFSIAGTVAFIAVGSMLYLSNGLSVSKYAGIDQKLRKIGVVEFEHNNSKHVGPSWELLNDITGDPTYQIYNDVDREHYIGENKGNKKRLLIVGNSVSRDLFNVLSYSREASQVFQVAWFGIEIENIDSQFYSSSEYRNADALVIAALLSAADLASLYELAVRVTDDNKKLYIVEQPISLPKVGTATLADRVVITSLESESLTLDELRDAVSTEITKHLMKPELSYKQRKLQETFKEVVSSIQRDLPQVSTLNSIDYMCPNGRCPGLTEEGRKIYYSHLHRTAAGAVFAGKSFSDSQFYDDLVTGLGLSDQNPTSSE